MKPGPPRALRIDPDPEGERRRAARARLGLDARAAAPRRRLRLGAWVLCSLLGVVLASVALVGLFRYVDPPLSALMIGEWLDARRAGERGFTLQRTWRPVAALLTLPAFILLVAAYVPRSWPKLQLGHPMVLAVKLWALAHLLMVGWLHSIVLFGSLLLWSILSFRAARRREPPSRASASAASSLLAVVIGTAAWAGFALYLHARWIGVAPFG